MCPSKDEGDISLVHNGDSKTSTINLINTNIMTKTSFYLRKTQHRAERATLCVRVRSGRQDLRAVTPITVSLLYWDAALPGYTDKTPAGVMSRKSRTAFNKRLLRLISKIEERVTAETDNGALKALIADFLSLDGENTDTRPVSEHTVQRKEQPKEQPKETGGMTLIDGFERYLAENSFSKRHAEQSTSILRKVRRFIDWKREMEDFADFNPLLDDTDPALLSEFREYAHNERLYYKRFPEFYAKYRLRPNLMVEISPNTMTGIMARLVFVLNWCVRQGYMANLAYQSFDHGVLVYGSPYYLTIEERDHILGADLTGWPQRLVENCDKFVFQCLVGCRLGDFVRLTTDNIKDGFLEYVPQKSLRKGNGATVRVPLCEKALALIARQHTGGKSLFKYHSRADYNSDIRLLLHLLGIHRVVTVLNRHTHREEQHPLYELATSHMARRTFIGNLYKKVKDQELVASVTGHSPGSKAFARYRAIDDEMKTELVRLID